MVLYHAISVYQIMCCIAHKMEEHSEDKCILILPDFIRTKFENYKDLEEFFDEVYLFPYTNIKHDKTTVYESVEKAYQETVPYPIENFESIINAGFHFYFSLFLLKHGQVFDVFEDSAGALSRGEALGESIRCSNEIFYEIMEENGLYTADNRLIRKCYCNFRAQSLGFSHPKAVDFDLTEKLKLFGRERIAKLLKIFRCPETIKTENPEALILTQHFSNLNQMEFEEQALLYQIIADYFLEGKKLIFKPHPDDITYYQRLFPQAKVIRGKFPSELLPYLFSEMPDELVSVSSTGSYLIKELFRDNLLFTFRYETEFQHTHKYYMALMFLKYLGYQEVSVCGADKNLVENLIKRCKSLDGMRTGEGRRAVIKDMPTEEQKIHGKADVILFLNTKKDFWFLEEIGREERRKLFPVVIHKKMTREADNYNPKEEEVVFAYSNHKELYDKMKTFSERKELSSVGDVLEVKALHDLEIKIKVLEGILEATEKRLLFYKEKCETLERKEEGR